MISHGTGKLSLSLKLDGYSARITWTTARSTASLSRARCAPFAYGTARTSRVVYALGSPIMGGVSRWNILGDETLSRRIPFLFRAPPQVTSGVLAQRSRACLARLESIGVAFDKNAPFHDCARGRGVADPASSWLRPLISASADARSLSLAATLTGSA